MPGSEIRQSESEKDGDQTGKVPQVESSKRQNDIIRRNTEDKYKIINNKDLLVKDEIRELTNQIRDLQKQSEKMDRLFKSRLAKLKWLLIECVAPKYHRKITDWQEQPRKMEKASSPLKLDTALHSEKQSSSEFTSKVDLEIIQSLKNDKWYKKLIIGYFMRDSQKRFMQKYLAIAHKVSEVEAKLESENTSRTTAQGERLAFNAHPGRKDLEKLYDEDLAEWRGFKFQLDHIKQLNRILMILNVGNFSLENQRIIVDELKKMVEPC